MGNFKLIFVVILFLSTLMVSGAFAASIEKAQMLNKHGLIQEAKAELIEIIFSKTEDAAKAQAYYLLGCIAFDENKINVALDSWRDLVKNFPESDSAKIVKDRLAEISELTNETSKDAVDNPVSLSYLRNGDFWSKGKTKFYAVDTSIISQDDIAIKWYDKVINEYPISIAARIAYENKLYIYLSICTKENIEKSMPPVLETFSLFEKEFPNASNLQCFRFQIAMAYKKSNDKKRTRDWIVSLIKNAGENDSFYKDLAERLLKKSEY